MNKELSCLVIRPSENIKCSQIKRKVEENRAALCVWCVMYVVWCMVWKPMPIYELKRGNLAQLGDGGHRARHHSTDTCPRVPALRARPRRHCHTCCVCMLPASVFPLHLCFPASLLPCFPASSFTHHYIPPPRHLYDFRLCYELLGTVTQIGSFLPFILQGKNFLFSKL